MKIELNCTTCGGNRFSLDSALTDESVIHCQDCGSETGTMGQLKKRVETEVLGRSLRLAS